MSFFKKILEKIGIGKDKKAESASAAAPAAKAATSTSAAAPAASSGAAKSTGSMASLTKDDMLAEPAEKKPAPVEMVDVVANLEKMAAANPAKLEWKVSIVDLLKLLDIDSSREARNELATELGCPAEFMSDSAKMNTWLHKEVLRKIAENGGNIPQELLD
jgi:hypothetical protein